MDFTNLDSLYSFLEKDISNTLQQTESNVKNVVVHEFIKQIDENIYDAYDPRSYARKMDQGGLTDRNNFEVTNDGSGIAVINTRKGSDRSNNSVYVLDIIEGNKEYSIEDVWGYGYEEPRYAVEPTIEALRNSGNLNRAFKVDLEQKGYKVE